MPAVEPQDQGDEDFGLKPGQLVAGRYRLESRLGGGGMGTVWRAHHLQLDAPVAVKFMHPSLVGDSMARQRFEREARAAAQIRSPYVVHVYDHGIDDDKPFIVMEYLEGEDLGRRLHRRGLMPRQDAVRICMQICKGLQRAHAQGIVHRDLKPGNVFLSSLDEDMVKILDFGIAKQTGARAVAGETTTTGQLLGSPHYMSPEQCRGQPLDGRSDLWSVAVILYRALTGKRPFDGDDIGDLIVRICVEPVPSARQYRAELDDAVDRFFEKAFRREPNDRFQDARDFAAAFAAALLEGTPNPENTGQQRAFDGQMSYQSLPRVTAADFHEVPTRTPESESYDLPTRTPVEASRTITAVMLLHQKRRRRLVVGAVAAAIVAATVTVALLQSSGEHVATPSATAEPVAAAAAQPAPLAAEPKATSAATAAVSAAPLASSAASGKTASARRRSERAAKTADKGRADANVKPPPPKGKTDLGY